jgi:hypothetical protein
LNMLRQRKTPGVGQVNKTPTFKEIVKQRAETDYSAQYEKYASLTTSTTPTYMFSATCSGEETSEIGRFTGCR